MGLGLAAHNTLLSSHSERRSDATAVANNTVHPDHPLRVCRCDPKYVIVKVTRRVDVLFHLPVLASEQAQHRAGMIAWMSRHCPQQRRFQETCAAICEPFSSSMITCACTCTPHQRLRRERRQRESCSTLATLTCQSSLGCDVRVFARVLSASTPGHNKPADRPTTHSTRSASVQAASWKAA